MHPAVRLTILVGVAAAAFLAWTMLGRRSPGTPARAPAVYRDPEGLDRLTAVTILRFYASPGVLVEGDRTLICYGVAKARSVRLDPPVEPLAPSLNRCIQAAPVEDTRYTLTAEGDDGSTVSESFTIQVRPDPQLLPRVTYFVGQKKGAPGDVVHSLCFAVENAERVSVDPPVIPSMEGAPRGCFYVAPRRTTTFTLTATGRRGRSARRSVTIAVP